MARGHFPSFQPSGLMLLLLHVVAGWAWAVFHILIITLQAFVFMMLTLVYIGQAHDAHLIVFPLVCFSLFPRS